MGISATPHRRQVRVIGPIRPTANRPTIEWAAQISVVKTSRRIGLAQTDCMSPVLSAVASVMNVFEGFEDCPQFTYRRVGGARGGRGLGVEIGSAGTEGKFVDGAEAKRIGSNEAHLTHAQAAWRASEPIVSRLASANAPA